MKQPRFMEPAEMAFHPPEAPTPSDQALGQAEITKEITDSLFGDPDAQEATVDVATIHDLIHRTIESLRAKGMLSAPEGGINALTAEAINDVTQDIFLKDSNSHLVNAETTAQIPREQVRWIVGKVITLADVSGRLKRDYKFTPSEPTSGKAA